MVFGKFVTFVRFVKLASVSRILLTSAVAEGPVVEARMTEVVVATVASGVVVVDTRSEVVVATAAGSTAVVLTSRSATRWRKCFFA